MALAAALIASYLLGSLVFGVIYSRLRGVDVRAHDYPGGSGMYRQYGLAASLGVTLADILKGALAVYLTHYLSPGWEWAATFLVVLGHCYPAFFGFNGGGGIAPFLGAMAVASPRVLGFMVLLSLVVMPTYRAFLQPRVGMNVIPFMALIVVPCSLVATHWLGGVAPMLAGAVAMAIRAVHWLIQGAWKRRPQ